MIRRLVIVAAAILALAAIAVAGERLLSARGGVSAEDVTIGQTPGTVFRPAPGDAVREEPPVVVVAHGFAGSRTLMAPFAVALAKNGYIALTFDFLGHGEHPEPLAGDVTAVEGATNSLVRQTRQVARFAQGLAGAGEELALLGHSMASDIVVRTAEDMPAVDATIAVSMFSPAVTADSPRNLLVIVGDWEPGLKAEALRAVGLSVEGEAEEGVTYGSFADGSARRAAFSGQAEHIAVLFDEESFAEAVTWLDETFGIDRAAPVATASRLPWIGLLVLGVLVLAWPLSRLLPVVSRPRVGAGLGWGRLWPVIVVPAVATPLVLRFLPTDFLPVVVGDYLAVHFLGYGLLTGLVLSWRRPAVRRPATMARAVAAAAPHTGRRRVLLALATLAVTVYAVGALGLVIDWTVTNYEPVAPRLPLLGAMLAGTLAYFVTNEWATRGEGSGRAGYVAAKGAFLVSIAIAVALDFERLFFLVIIVPVIVLFFVIYGLFSQLSYRRTGHPLPAAVANALAFAWAITVTFPMLAG